MSRMESEQRREQLMESIPDKAKLLMDAADLEDMKDDEDEWLELFPPPPVARCASDLHRPQTASSLRNLLCRLRLTRTMWWWQG